MLNIVLSTFFAILFFKDLSEFENPGYIMSLTLVTLGINPLVNISLLLPGSFQASLDMFVVGWHICLLVIFSL